MDTQREVAEAWVRGLEAEGSNMHTDGLTVYSYGWHPIGFTNVTKNGNVKEAIVCSYSVTTRGKHVNALLRVADVIAADEHTNKHGMALVKKGMEESQ